MKRADHEVEKKKKKKKKSRKHEEEEDPTQEKKKKKHKKEDTDALVDSLKKALGPIPSIKTPASIANPAPATPHHQQQPAMEWLKEQEIFHNFVPQSVEAHIMFLHLTTRTLCGEMNKLAEAVTIPLRNYKAPAERIVSEAAASHRGLPEAEALVELLSLTRAMHADMAGFVKGMDKCTRALLAIHKSVQELATKSHARMRNITAHTFNSYVFSANTPGSSLLTVPTVPQ